MKYQKTLASDSLQNVIASIGTGTDRVSKSEFVSDSFFSNEELGAMYMGWLGRRIVDLVPQEALKRGWEIRCPSWKPEKIDFLNSYVKNRLGLLPKMVEALKWSRAFGGSILFALVDSRFGAFANPVPDFLPKNSLLGIQCYDAWQCYPATMNFSNPLKKNYRYPETYTIGASEMAIMSNMGKNGESDSEMNKAFIQGTLVHWTRTERFDGLELPWYLRQVNMYWGQSTLSNAYEAVRNAKGVDASIASLLFRASVPVLKVQDLAGIIADPEARQAFLERVNLLNYGMSNNNMGIIDAEETLESFEPSAISGMDSILERYYILCSSATGIPVTKLVGESARGLNATGEGDLDNYYDMLEDYQTTIIHPALTNIYKRWIIPSVFDELMPSDFEIYFPPLERVSPEKKQQQDSDFVSMVINCLDAEIIDKKIARKEIQERGVFDNFTADDIERLDSEKSENEIGLDEAMDSVDVNEDTESMKLLDTVSDSVPDSLRMDFVLLRSKVRDGSETAKEFLDNKPELRKWFNEQ